MRTFDHPAIGTEAATVFGTTLRDHRFDAAFAQCASVPRRIIAPVGIDDLGLLKWSTACTSNRWNRIDQGQQLRDVVIVRAGQDRDDGNAIGIYEDVVLGTRARAIRGVRASFSPAPTARTDDESTAAYERSSCPAARNLSSSNACKRSHTPAFCQSSNRRQQVAPEPKPSWVGKWFQRMPVLSTNRMPLSAARSGTRGRPGSLFARGFTGGSNGSISFHNSSSMIGASILEFPLLRCPRLTASRESKQPPHGVFELAS